MVADLVTFVLTVEMGFFLPILLFVLRKIFKMDKKISVICNELNLNESKLD